MLPFSRADLERLFPNNVWLKAEQLVTGGAVIDAELERDGKSVIAKVKGERRSPYLTRVKIANGRGGRVRLTSTCTCLVYSECEHAAAALMGLLDRAAAPEPDEVAATLEPELESWLVAMSTVGRNPQGNGLGTEGAERVLYLLEPAQRSWRDGGAAQPISVTTARARLLAGGAYGREQPIAIMSLVADEPASFVRLEDQIVGRLLAFGLNGVTNGQSRRLSGAADGEALRRMLETGRCHWRNLQGQPLRFAGERAGRFGWRFDSEGQQHVVCELDDVGEDAVIVGLGQPWYIDLQENIAGPISTDVPDHLAGFLLRAPAVPATAATVVRQRLQPTNDRLPLPEPLKHRERNEVRPKPTLHLHCPNLTISRGLGWKREEQDVDCPLAKVTFAYAGCEVSWQDGRTELNHVVNNRLIVMPRDTVFEVQCIERLNALGLQPLGPTGLGRFASEALRQDFTFEEDEDDEDVSMRWVEFNHKELPKLVLDGWDVTFDPDYPYQVAQTEGGLVL